MKVSCEQQARDILERMEVPNAQDYRPSELVEIANLIDDKAGLSCEGKNAFEAGYDMGRADAWHNYPPRAKGAYNEWQKKRVSEGKK